MKRIQGDGGPLQKVVFGAKKLANEAVKFTNSQQPNSIFASDKNAAGTTFHVLDSTTGEELTKRMSGYLSPGGVVATTTATATSDEPKLTLREKLHPEEY